MRMELALPERFDTRQALRYLGISTEEPDSATRALLRRAERTLRAAAGPRAVAVRAARDDISPYLQGNDILRHLEGCGSCVLLACTLGARVDAALRAAGASDMLWCCTRWLLWRWSRRPMPLNRRCAMRNGRKGSF